MHCIVNTIKIYKSIIRINILILLLIIINRKKLKLHEILGACDSLSTNLILMVVVRVLQAAERRSPRYYRRGRR